MDVIESTATTATDAEPVTPFGTDERRLMYIFMRIPFVPVDLNWMQVEYLPVFLEWGWYECRADGLIQPTPHFLERLALTQAEQLRAEQAQRQSATS